jgi:hypothetical protein
MEKKYLLKVFKDSFLKKNIKNKNSIINEFENDKWKRALNCFGHKKKINIFDVDRFFLNKSKYYIFNQKKFITCSAKKAKNIQFKIIRQEIEKYLDRANEIVEIGAGYGSNVFRLIKLKKFKIKKILSLDNSQNALKLSRKIASRNKIKNIFFDWCDLYKGLSKKHIKPNSVIFTSYCLHYGKILPKKFMNFLIRSKPKYVIHFEPFYEFFRSKKNTHMRLCKKYVINNDYSRNLFTILHSFKLKKKIEIVYVKKNIMGINPFLPFSIVTWKLNDKK